MESNNSPYPKIKSKEAIKALVKLKEMKNELGESMIEKIKK